MSGASGRVKSLVASSADDTQVTLTGNQLRNALGLRSTWFTPALLQLSPAARTITYGGATVAARRRPRCERPVARGEAGRREPGPTPGRCPSTRTGRSRSSSSRRSRPSTASPGAMRARVSRRSAVAARVSAVVTPQGVQGTLRPLAPGAPVQLQQRQDDGTWATLDSATADASSAWSLHRAARCGHLPRPRRARPRRRRRRVGAVHRAVRRLALLVALAALVVPAVAAAFANTEPYAAKEWYLDQDQAWSFWPTMPSLAPVKVAIIDSGIDGVASRSRRTRRRSASRSSAARRTTTSRDTARSSPARSPPTRRTGSAWPASRSTPA